MSIQAVATNANSIIVKLNNIEKGKYAVSLLNTAGQKIYSGNIYHQGGSANEVIKLNSVLAAGIYHLQLSNNDKIHNAQLIVP
jgi:F0F1-type ATP synthase delta subunit